MNAADVELYPMIIKNNLGYSSEVKKTIIKLLLQMLPRMTNDGFVEANYEKDWNIEKAKAEEINGVKLVAAIILDTRPIYGGKKYLAAFASSYMSNFIFEPIETKYLNFNNVNIFTMFSDMSQAREEMKELCKLGIKDKMSDSAINTFGDLVDEL